jgi:hypothetical protein
MPVRLIMTVSAMTLAVIGISLTFAPREILNYTRTSSTPILLIVLQLLGALYFAFAMLNWTAKGATIGGIYNKPISISNFVHFLVGGLALTKALIYNQGLPYFLWVLTGIYLVFALCFGIIFTRHPADKRSV